jgi:hypothetical protein
MSKSNWRWWVVPLLLLACWLGARSLNADTIWYDEYWSLYDSGGATGSPRTFTQIWDGVAARNPWHPPGYFAILSFWERLAGWTPFTGRAFSLLIGLMAIAWTYRIARDVASPMAGVGAAVTLGVSAFFIYHLHELRAYTLFAFFTALSLWSYLRLINTQTPVWVYATFLVGVLGLPYSHYLAALVVGAIGLYHLLFAPKNRIWWVITVLALVAVALYLPWFNVVLRAVRNVSNDPSRSFFAYNALSLTQELLTRFSNANIGLLTILGWFATRRLNRKTGLIWFVTLATFVLTVVFNEFVPFISDARYLMALWPLLAVVMGLGISNMAASHLRPQVVLVVWAAAGLWLVFVPTPTPGEWVTHLAWDRLAVQLRLYAHRGDSLIFFLPREVPNWIHQPIAGYYLRDVPVQINLLESLVDKTPDEFSEQSHEFIGDAGRVWVALAPQYAPSDLARAGLEGALAEHYAHCETTYATPEMRLDLYALTSNRVPRLSFDGDIILSLLEPIPATISGSLQVLTSWSQNIPAGTYSAGLHMDDANGNFVAQADFGLPPTSSGCHLSVIEGLPPGDYTLYALVYNAQSGERLSGVALDTGEMGDRLALGDFTIER